MIRGETMRIGIHDADKKNFPNLALMKLSAWHKSKGDSVEFYDPLFASMLDKVYSSKVFTFTKEEDLFGNIEKGGTGYYLFSILPDEVEHICPDYSLYDVNYSLGFLTRGCPNHCTYCIVPRKEGDISAHADIDEFLRHKDVILMDNNVLASEHGIRQIEKLIELNVKVDFNQGIDARLIDNNIAKLLSRVKWRHPIRLACDHPAQMGAIQKAVSLLRWHNTRPPRYFVYCLIKDIDEALERVKFLKGLYLEPFAQPFIDYQGEHLPTKRQREFARWVNHTAVFNSIAWEDYDAGYHNNGMKQNSPHQIGMFR